MESMNDIATAATPLGTIYGPENAVKMAVSRVRDDVRDRAAYVYVTGQFPSHLGSNYMGVLTAIAETFSRPVALDGRSGSLKLTNEAVHDLDLENHPMVVEVRDRVAKGWVIQPTRDPKARRNYSKVFLYRREQGGQMNKITVTREGAVRSGW